MRSPNAPSRARISSASAPTGCGVVGSGLCPRRCASVRPVASAVAMPGLPLDSSAQRLATGSATPWATRSAATSCWANGSSRIVTTNGDGHGAAPVAAVTIARSSSTRFRTTNDSTSSESGSTRSTSSTTTSTGDLVANSRRASPRWFPSEADAGAWSVAPIVARSCVVRSNGSGRPDPPRCMHVHPASRARRAAWSSANVRPEPRGPTRWTTTGRPSRSVIASVMASTARPATGAIRDMGKP